MNTPINQKPINVGVDTGKYQLDIYIRPLDIFFSVNNDEEGIKQAVQRIKKHHPERIIIEATGRLEHAFIVACSKAALPVVISNPAHIRKFAGALGQYAKTDRLDATLLAHFGEAIQPTLSVIKPESMRIMSDLLTRRRQLMTLQTMEKNRSQIMPKETMGFIKPLLTVIKNQLDKVDKKLLKMIKNCDVFNAKNIIIQSVPGIGNVVAMTLISDMPELGKITNKQAAALVGVAPMNRESGTYKGHRRIRGGRYQIRTVMFMAMMSAIQCNPIFKAKYRHLLAQGKPKKLALIACVRNMVVILNSMLRDGKQWNPKIT